MIVTYVQMFIFKGHFRYHSSLSLLLIGPLQNGNDDGNEDVAPKHKFTLFVTQKNCFSQVVRNIKWELNV